MFSNFSRAIQSKPDGGYDSGLIVVGLYCADFGGLTGILICSILSNIYRDIDLLFYIPHKLTKLKVRTSFYRMLRVFICFGLICWPFVQFIHIDCHNFLEWTGWAVITAIYALLVVVIVNYLLDRRVFMNVMGRFKSLTRKRSVT